MPGSIIMRGRIKNRGNLPVAVCLPALLVLSGCGHSGSEIAFKSGGMTQRIAEGKGSLPEDFPLPFYPQAIAEGSVSAEGGATDETSKFLMLSCRDSVETVSRFYMDKLQAEGWQVRKPQISGNLVNISAAQRNLEANVMVSRQAELTSISLSVSSSGKSPGKPGGGNEQRRLPGSDQPATD